MYKNDFHFQNDYWLVDYSPDTDKGYVIRLKDVKEFYFSKQLGLSSHIPIYIRNVAKSMLKK